MTEQRTLELDDDNENWLRELRLKQLRERGWTGTLAEWFQQRDKLGHDPLEQPTQTGDEAR